MTPRGVARIGLATAETLQPLIDDGTLTQEQADAVTSCSTPLARKGMGPGGRGGPPGVGLDAAAMAPGVTQAELMTALRDGQSIADVTA